MLPVMLGLCVLLTPVVLAAWIVLEVRRKAWLNLGLGLLLVLVTAFSISGMNSLSAFYERKAVADGARGLRLAIEKGRAEEAHRILAQFDIKVADYSGEFRRLWYDAADLGQSLVHQGDQDERREQDIPIRAGIRPSAGE